MSVTHRRFQILVSAFDFVCIFHPCLNLFCASFEVSESFSKRCQALHFVKLLCFSGLVREQCDVMKSKRFRKATYAICFTLQIFFFLLSKVWLSYPFENRNDRDKFLFYICNFCSFLQPKPLFTMFMSVGQVKPKAGGPIHWESPLLIF